MERHKATNYILFLILVLEMNMCSATRLGDWVGQEQQHGGECIPIRQKFAELNLGSASQVPASKIHDADMDICYNAKLDTDKQTCCTSTTERQYAGQVNQDIHAVMKQTGSYLKKLITTNVAHYQDLFISLLRQAHNNTENLFRDIYTLPVRDSNGPVDSFFLDLEAFIKRGDVHIQDSTDAFFDALFPIVYHNNVNDPSTTELNEDYRECLMEIRQDLYPQPFGQVPSRLSHQLAKSFSFARSFLEALHVGVEVMNMTESMALDRDCTHALTRLTYCAHCEGYVDVAPCKEFCYNVMRGCLAYLDDVDERWNEFVDTLQQLAANMRGQYDIEEVLNSLHTRVSDAVLHAMETGIRFNDKVKNRCGQPKPSRELRSSYDDKTGKSGKHHKKHNTQMMSQNAKVGTKLYSKVEMFMRNLVASKGFFLHLPDTLCSADKFSASLDGTCWNGEDLNPYNKSVVAMELVVQIDNPEVKISDSTPQAILNITDKLQHMKKILAGRVLTAQKDKPDMTMQGDDAWAGQKGHGDGYKDWGYKDWNQRSSGDWANYGSDGSYSKHSYPGYPPDDEEAYYSGSGSGDNIYNPDYPIHRTKPNRNRGVNEHEDIGFDSKFLSDTEPPYVTPDRQDSNWRPAEGAAGSASSGLMLTLSMCILSTITLWLNG